MPLQCRTCGEPIFNADPRNLFKHENEDLRHKFEVLTGIKLREDIHMPNYICACCHLDLCHAMAFRERCRQTEQLFQQRKSERMKLKASGRLSSGVTQAAHSRPKFFQIQKLSIPAHQLISKEKYSKVDAPVESTPKPLDSWNNEEENLSSSSEDLNNWSGDERSSEAPNPEPDPKNRTQPFDDENKAEPTKQENVHNNNKNKTSSISKKEEKLDKFICELCGLQSATTPNHEIHMRRHKGEKNFKCEECGSRHYSKYLMELHYRVKHKGEKPFACKFCGERFHSGSTRIRHENRKSDNNKSYVCDQCGRCFADASNLKIHIVRHTGVKAFDCEICNVAFPRNTNLKIHYRSKQHQKRASEVKVEVFDN
ncbi:hypothetical protein KR044_008063, partial [Drosophila immigrans]